MLVLYVFLVAWSVQLLFWAGILSGAYLKREQYTTSEERHSRVSIIVCFRNEERTLELLIDGILAQVYPGDYELVLVDDNSTDGSAAIASVYADGNDHIHLVAPGPTRPGKKDALAFGIARAAYDHLLLTDADCAPGSSHWLWLMTEPLRQGKELVLGVSPLLRGRARGWLRRWQFFESVYVSIKYLGFARYRPYMGVGRNLAYTREFYQRAGGFAAHADLPGGDDDLLVAGHATARNTARVSDPAAWTHAAGPENWPAYFRQRARHQSTGIHYPWFMGLILSLIALSHGVFYLAGLWLLIKGWYFLVGGTYLLRLLIVHGSYRRPLRATDVRRVGRNEPAADEELRSLWWVFLFMLGDALVGPAYLYLALSQLRRPAGW